MFTSSRRFFVASPVHPLLWFGSRGACAVPHPEKAKRGGEDAFFVHTSGIGVADGVGGYARMGVDPAIFTRNVMRFTRQALEEDQNRGTITALEALNRGFAEAQKQGHPGGCPVTLVTLVDGRFASVLNLGDCGTICLRSSKLFFATEAQQHRFNCPYQLPEDPPSLGERTTLEVSEGDVFLCASDGLLDNVDISDILRYLENVGRDGCQRVAEGLAEQACRNGVDKKFKSPFAKNARAMGYHYSGGKEDDVTVVVAQLTRLDVKPNACAGLVTELLKMQILAVVKEDRVLPQRSDNHGKMETKFIAALKECETCKTYQELCERFDARVRSLLEGYLRTALVRPVREHVSPDECSPRVTRLREVLHAADTKDDVWFFLYRAAAMFLERCAKKRGRDDNTSISTAVVNAFVLFYGRVPPDLSNLRLQWSFLRKEKLRFEASEAYVHSNAGERRKALMTSVLSVFSERAHRHYFTALWMPCFHHAAEAALHLHLLHRIGDVILPYLTNPLVVADYLSGCFASGGLVAVLALHGIFLLMLDHGMEYPQYYQQLYTLLTPDAFASRHRYDLFRLLDLSMSSLRVPSYVAAAFSKRVARVALLSPAPVLYFALPFIRKLLQRHPNCLALIHRHTKEAAFPVDNTEIKEDTEEEMGRKTIRLKQEAQKLTATLFDGNDPFLPEESLERCNALHSTLWEFTALERHFIPTVPLMVSAFASTVEDQAPLRYEKTYARLFTAEVTRPMSESQLPTVAYREPEEDDSTNSVLLV